MEKFKPKRTTDDCYTPHVIYDAVLNYCVDRYGIDPKNVERPFFPGGDFERHNYPAGCCVVDNPPFSIISRIVAWYQKHQIRFFLFCPYLTSLSTNVKGVTHIFAPCSITYENGAKVSTCFLTNMEPGVLARSDPALLEALKQAEKKHTRENKRSLPKYAYPDCVLTATMMGYIALHGVEFKVLDEDAVFIRGLDAQKAVGKGMFGSGYLLSEKAAAEKAAAEKAGCIFWAISDRERMLIEEISK